MHFPGSFCCAAVSAIFIVLALVFGSSPAQSQAVAPTIETRLRTALIPADSQRVYISVDSAPSIFRDAVFYTGYRVVPPFDNFEDPRPLRVSVVVTTTDTFTITNSVDFERIWPRLRARPPMSVEAATQFALKILQVSGLVTRGELIATKREKAAINTAVFASPKALRVITAPKSIKVGEAFLTTFYVGKPFAIRRYRVLQGPQNVFAIREEVISWLRVRM